MNVLAIKVLTLIGYSANSLSEQSPLLPLLENGLHYESPTVRTQPINDCLLYLWMDEKWYS